jgi:ribosomal-protein-alanine acetyltransferase
MTITIEDAQLRQLDKLYEIELQCFDKEAFSKRQISYFLTDYNSISLIARVESKIAGFIIVQVDSEENVFFGHILTINVAPDYWHKGIATRLIHEIENILRRKSIFECRLEVKESNQAALNLYHKLGYENVGKLKNYYGRAHGLYLKKTLTNA